MERDKNKWDNTNRSAAKAAPAILQPFGIRFACFASSYFLMTVAVLKEGVPSLASKGGTPSLVPLYPTLYPCPQTTFRNLGSCGLSSIFSLMWRMCTATVLSAPMGAIFQMLS